jgi:hypothetical protein
MASAEQLLVRIDATTEQLRREFARADASIEQFDRKTRGSLNKLDGSLRKINAAFAVLQGPLGAISGRFSSLGALIGAVNPVVAAAAVGFATFTATIGKSVAVAEQFERASLKTQAILRATGNASGQTANSIRELSKQIAANTLATTAGVETAAQKLLTFKSISEDTFRRTLELSQDLAEVGFGSIETAVVQLGKALEDPAKGLTALTRVGVSFSAQQKETIQSLYDMGDALGAQTLLLDAVEQQVGGTGRAAAGGLSGAYDTLSQNVEEFLLNVGNVGPIDSATAAVRGLGDAIGKLNKQLFPDKQTEIERISERLARMNAGAATMAPGGMGINSAAVRERADELKSRLADLLELQKLDRQLAESARQSSAGVRDEAAAANTADRAKAVQKLIDALKEEVAVARLSDAERAKRAAGDKAEKEARDDITGVTEEHIKIVRAAAEAAEAEMQAIKASQNAAKDKAKEDEKLSALRAETVADLAVELEFQKQLLGAHKVGAEAIDAVTDAYEAAQIVQQLKLQSDGAEAAAIAAIVVETNNQKRAIEKVTDAQKEAEQAAKKFAAEQKKAAEDATREYDKLIDSIANVSQEKLGDALFTHLKGETVDFAAFLKDTLLRTIADIAAAALTQQIVIPIAAQVIGAAPGLFGLSGGAAQVAQSSGGLGWAGNLIGAGNSIYSIFGGGASSLASQFAMSGFGASLGLSTTAGTATALGVAAVPGGASAAMGGAAGGTSMLTGAGSALAAAAPYIAAAVAAGALLFGSGMFGGGPSVGPVGIADFSPGLGRRRAFEVPGIDPFTADNGGNGESLRPIAEAIADLIADSADRFSATIDESLRFRVANYGGPEGGSGREAGFEVNAFIRGEAEKRVAEGLSQEQAVFEALKFAIQEAFTFDSATIAEAAANTAGTTTEEILADLDFAKNFEALGEALANLGGTVDANTLALAQQTVAIQQQAEAFAEANAQPIVDALAKAIELFPGQITETISRTVSDGAAIADLLLGESRFVDDRGNEYIGNLPYGSDADRDALGRVILPSGSDADRDADGRLVFPGFTEGDDRYIRAVEQVQTITEDVSRVSAAYAANLERVGLAVDMAKAGMDLLVDQITGDFEPAVRGPFQQALEQGQANLDALRTHFEDVNTQIAAANEAFPGLNNALIDVTQAISDAQAALLANLQEDFRQQVADALDPETANRRAFVDASKVSLTDAVSIGLGGDEPLMRDLFRAFSDGAMAAGLGIQGTVAALDDLRIAAGDAGVTVTQLVDGALAELRTTFERDIQAQINAATGLGGVNVIQDLIEARGQTEADAAALGLNVNDTAGRLFDAQLRQAFDGASLADLGRILDSGQIVDAGARAILETLLAEEALAAARASELAGLEALSTTTEAFAAAANQNARTLRQAANAMLVNSTLSPLDPLARLQESERQLMEAFSLANDSDPTDDLSQDAISRLPGLIQTDNELAREYYASTAAYQERFFRNQDLLGSTALRQESIEQQQLSALRDIEAAIAGLDLQTSGGTPSQQAAAAGFNFGSNPANPSIYDALVAAGLPTPSGFGAGQSNELRAGNSAVDALLRAMGFANGGAFVNGMPVNFFASGGIVDRPTAFGMRSGLGVMGEAGPEAIMPLDRINGRLGVRAIVPSNDSGGTVAAINALRDEVSMLRRENAEQARQIASVTAGGSLRVAGAVQDGNATTKRMASSAERNAARPVAA